MNRTSLIPAVARMLTLSTVPLLTYLGVTQYNELNKVELPKLPIEIESEEIVKSTEPQKRIRRVWKQTKGTSFTSWFGSSYSTYRYTNKQLSSHCKSGNVYLVFRNWCNQAEFQEVEEEIPQ